MTTDFYLTGYVSSNTDTTARFGIYNSTASPNGPYHIRWRYITATDKPFAHIIRDITTGEILHIWLSGDPPPAYWGIDELPEDYEPPILLHPRPSGLEDIVVHKYPLEDYIEVLEKSKTDKRLLHRIVNDDYDFDRDKKVFVSKNLRVI